MTDFLGENGKKALDIIVSAVAHSTDCDMAIFFVKENVRWKSLSVYGINNNIDIDSITINLLNSFVSGEKSEGKIFSSDQDMLKLNKSLYIGRFVHAKKVSDGNLTATGLILIGSTQRCKALSAAQMYALEAHAIVLGDLIGLRFNLNSEGVSEKADRLRLLESVVINARDAILITEAEPISEPGPKIVYCNPAFEAATGFNQKDIIGLTPRILQCAQTQRSSLDLIRDSISKWKPIEIELINAKSDGSLFWVQLSIVPVANELGYYTHWVSVQRDISERKESESLVERANLEIEKKKFLEMQLQERERAEINLTYKAFHDDLTKLYNRAYIMKKLEVFFKSRSISKKTEATILFLDLDGFKEINDSMGHQAGDILLVTVADRMQSSVREQDVLARIGGDEFAILLTGEGQSKSAIEIADRIVDIFRQPVTIDGQKIFTSGSIGIVSSNHTHHSPSDLLRDADVAMYSAKKAGKSQWKFFSPAMRSDAVKILDVHNAIRKAVMTDQFSLVYQPIINSFTGRTLAVEALLRLQDEKLGTIPPSVFIPILEDLGLIREIGRWVMQNACLDIVSWKKNNPQSNLILSVNVSAKELKLPGYVDQVISILKYTGFEPKELQIEITESVFIKNPDMAATNLKNLRLLGVRVAIDDFGTGFSSLSYIDKYPIDAIKIDQAFTSRMISSVRTSAIVKCLISLCEILELAITAEGVETSEQLLKLQTLGCFSQQGFFISKPLKISDLISYLERDVTTNK